MRDPLLLPVADNYRWARWVAVAVLVIAVLLAGVYDQKLIAAIGRGWLTVAQFLSFDQAADYIKASNYRQGPHRPSLPGATYMGLYVGLCLLILRLLLRTPAEWRIVWRTYASIATVYLLLILISKAGGDLRWPYRLSRHLLSFLVSPLPILTLLVLLRGAKQVIPARAS